MAAPDRIEKKNHNISRFRKRVEQRSLLEKNHVQSRTQFFFIKEALKQYLLSDKIMSDEELLSTLESKLETLETTSRKMFGGTGIFSEKIMFSLIYDKALYFRSIKEIASSYSNDSVQFQHPSRDSKMPYWSVPDSILSDKSLLSDWANEAFSLAKSLKKK